MKKFLQVLVISFSILLSNISMIFADGYGHVPVDTSFVLDSKTISALIAVVLFGIGASLIVEGKYFRNTSK